MTTQAAAALPFPPTKTRSQQRIEQLINAGRALTDAESDELYRALHADYVRERRLAKRLEVVG